MNFQLPSKHQWLQLFKVLTRTEKIIFGTFFILFLGSALFLSSNFYYKNTEIQPARGGHYVEGVIGSPRFINPLYAINDVDRDLVELVFSSLLSDLAQDYKIKKEGEIFEIFLKKNVRWHDGQNLTAEDVIFTIETLQNPEYKSPLRANWLGVKVEKLSDFGIRFKLKNPYSGFLERLDLKIIPKHIWQEIPSQNFPLSVYNLRPIGSGPYKIRDLKQDSTGGITSLTLGRFPDYFDRLPYLSQITFRFYKKEAKLARAAHQEEITGFTINSFEKFDQFNQYSFSIPRYFAVFFNPIKSQPLTNLKVRRALNYGTDREEIVREILAGKGKVVHSPLLPFFYGFAQPQSIYIYNLKKAKKLLDEAGFEKKKENQRVKIIEKQPAFQFTKDLKQGSRGEEVKQLQKCLAKDPKVYPEAKITGYFGPKTKKAVIRFQEKYRKAILTPLGLRSGTGIVGKTTRAKLNELYWGKKEQEILPLSFTLITVEDPILKKVAQQLQTQWEKIGVKLEIKTYLISTLLQDFIKPRNYEMLLFGQVLGEIPDPFPFWHSSQKKHPGFNLAGYENKKVDKLLSSARTTLDEKVRTQKYQQFQDILIGDAPTIFLYTPDYLYWVSSEIKGIETGMIVKPSKRFAGIKDWYIKTKRVWK